MQKAQAGQWVGVREVSCSQRMEGLRADPNSAHAELVMEILGGEKGDNGAIHPDASHLQQPPGALKGSPAYREGGLFDLRGPQPSFLPGRFRAAPRAWAWAEPATSLSAA